jgi:hypothetical protein
VGFTELHDRSARLERGLEDYSGSLLLSPDDVRRFAVRAGRLMPRTLRKELARQLRRAADELDGPMMVLRLEVGCSRSHEHQDARRRS